MTPGQGTPETAGAQGLHHGRQGRAHAQKGDGAESGVPRPGSPTRTRTRTRTRAAPLARPSPAQFAP